MFDRKARVFDFSYGFPLKLIWLLLEEYFFQNETITGTKPGWLLMVGRWSVGSFHPTLKVSERNQNGEKNDTNFIGSILRKSRRKPI